MTRRKRPVRHSSIWRENSHVRQLGSFRSRPRPRGARRPDFSSAFPYRPPGSEDEDEHDSRRSPANQGAYFRPARRRVVIRHSRPFPSLAASTSPGRLADFVIPPHSIHPLHPLEIHALLLFPAKPVPGVPPEFRQRHGHEKDRQEHQHCLFIREKQKRDQKEKAHDP